jgi:2,5-diketo-D-gluconate reductase A
MNGVVMPAIGFGVYQIPKEDTKRCVLDALEVGYRSIDTAAAYFNEREVGEAIRESGLPRESVFVTTKLWVQDYEYDDALRAVEKSLSELGLDTVDLVLLHKPYGNYYAAWRALERFYKEGRIRAIGVTSFSDERLQDLFLHNEVKPAVNQIETHPFRQQQKSNEFLKAEGIVHETWSPFAEGQKGIFTNPVLVRIAQAHGKSVAAVILRWLNQRGVVVIPKSVRRERMAENLNILDFTLSPEEMGAIATLNEEKNPIYDENDLATVRGIGLHKIHD